MTKPKATKKRRNPNWVYNDSPSLTKQDGAQTPSEVFRRFTQGVPLPEGRPPQYGDVSQIDFARMRNTIAAFESGFEELPAVLRARFANDSAEYLDFIEDNSAAIDENGLSAVLRAYMKETEGSLDETPENASQGDTEPENAQTEPENPQSGDE